jgi:hypothetical protein
MKSSFSPSRSSGFIEPLESRVAPAVINIGAPASTPNFPTSVDTSYDTGLFGNHDPRSPANAELHFVATYLSPADFADAASDPISQALNTGSGNTYYLVLHKGDIVNAFSSAGYTPMIHVLAGNVVAFFTDINNDDRYETGELTGLALGKSASVQLLAPVNGDVVTALNDSSKIPSNYAIDTVALVSSKQGITNLFDTAGPINGNVLSGGNIAHLNLQNVNNVFAGTAANGAPFDFFQIPDQANPGQFVKRFTVGFTEPAGQAGASISNAEVGSLGHSVTTLVGGQPVTTFVPGILQAGDGGSGAKGGVLSNVWITNDGNAFSLLAGNGGDGIAGKVAGGAGGALQHITVSGVTGSVANAQINIEAGHGGNGFGVAAGGAGGAASNVFVGFGLFGNTPVASTNLSSDNVLVESGMGGIGKIGGKGGLLSSINLRVSTPVGTGDELSLVAGDGGNANSPLGGKAGVGAAIQNVQVLNEIDTAGSTILLHAGDGGTATGKAAGAAGGAISNATILGYDFEALAGDGSSGKTGGAGGAITGIALLQGVNILNQEATFNSGFGGDGSAGNGGKGGSVSKINIPIADFSSFLINTNNQGDGGNSIGGKGGAGGSVAGLNIQDIDGDPGSVASTLAGPVSIRAGDGGDGDKGGGVGGSLGGTASAGILFTGFGLSMTATSGHGGNALVSGPGGAGGTVRAVNFTAVDNFMLTHQNVLDVTASITAGNGGNGILKGKGGSGGGISFVNLDTDGQVALIAGSGGDGQAAVGGLKGSAPGIGGSIVTSGAFANNSSGVIEAGNAGAIGVGAAAGGSLIGGKTVNSLVGLRAETSLVLTAGNGSGGGAGGDIVNVTYGSTALSLSPTPSGNIIVQAGDGSGAGKIAGRGGLINHLSGAVTSGPGAVTTIRAGNGGSTATKGGAGGSVSDVTILGGGAPQAIFTIAAGDAGDAPNGKTGAAGGSVNGVQVSNLDQDLSDPTDLSQQTVFRSVAAGNGGSAGAANGKGGVGGSINGVFVLAHDIGIRTGLVFGYESAGGLFAGVGGAGSKPGLNGSVTNIQANAIASIVAGRTLVPQEVQNVNHVFVQDNSVLLTSRSLVQPGAFTLTYDGASTTLLPVGATTQQVAAALDQLATIQATGPGGVNGSVTVTSGSTPGTYNVLFNTTGQKLVITGVEQLPVTAGEVIAGNITVVPVTETTAGTQPNPATITQDGEFNLGVSLTFAGEVDFVASETVQGDADTGTDAVQSIDLRDLSAVPTATFTLSYDSATTANLSLGSDPVANALTIQNALNGLATIAAAGNVTVAPNPTIAGTFTITFSQPAAVDDITGSKFFPEAQQLNLGAVTNSPNGTFNLTFDGQTTATLLANSSAATIENALNSLPNIPAGGVSVTAVPKTAGAFNIVFNSNGNEPIISGVGDLSESQSLDLSNAQPFGTSGSVTLSFQGQNTAPLPVTASVADIAAALNGLSTIQADGNVTVSQTGPHAFAIVFGNTGHEEAIVASLTVPEVQAVDISSVDHISNGQFALTFNGSMTPELPANVSAAAAAAEIQSALNDLPSIQATGTGGTGGMVTVVPAGPDHFAITFNTQGEEALISGVGQTFEVQHLQVYAAPASGTFTLTYDSDTTPPLHAGADALTVQTALNNLPDIPAGGVVVTNGVNGIYTVTFNQAGPVDVITGLQFEPMNTTTIGGTSNVAETETISVVPKGAFDPVKFAHADLVGSIFDINAIDANVFHYFDPANPGVVEAGAFKIGDTPIDGIVLAHNFDQSTVNFTPEAKFTDQGFFDNLNS